MGDAEASNASGVRIENPGAVRPRGRFYAMGLGGSKFLFGIHSAKNCILSKGTIDRTGKNSNAIVSAIAAIVAHIARQSTLQTQ
jgi:hypothetical protein